MCNVNYSVLFVTDFILYVCMPGVFHVAEKDNVAWVYDSVTVFFILSWKLKFLAYLSMYITYRYEYHFITKCCVFHMYVNVNNCCSWQCMVGIGAVTP
jgi:hypothetical protein